MEDKFISAKALLDKLKVDEDWDKRVSLGGALADFIILICDAPAIEAKPVVYCKDCKYNVENSKHDPLDITDYTDITCEYFMTDGMEADDFCSKGVKIPVISMEDVPKLAKD